MSRMKEHLASIALPCIHPCCTDRDTQLAQRCNACAKLREAYDSLRAMPPQRRDYYPAGIGQYELAVETHRRRLTALDMLLGEIEYEIHEIAEATA